MKIKSANPETNSSSRQQKARYGLIIALVLCLFSMIFQNLL